MEVIGSVFNVQLGADTPLVVDDFNLPDVYLEIQIFASGTGWEILVPRQRLTATAFAIKAGNAQGVYSEAHKGSTDTAGTAYGGYFIGDNDRDGDDTGEESYAVLGEATGLNRSRYGVYGRATTSGVGDTEENYGVYAEAWVTLPDYFEALNGDFRYQLTALGAPGPNFYIAEKISGNRFKIAGGQPNMEVS